MPKVTHGKENAKMLFYLIGRAVQVVLWPVCGAVHISDFAAWPTLATHQHFSSGKHCSSRLKTKLHADHNLLRKNVPLFNLHMFN